MSGRGDDPGRARVSRSALVLLLLQFLRDVVPLVLVNTEVGSLRHQLGRLATGKDKGGQARNRRDDYNALFHDHGIQD